MNEPIIGKKGTVFDGYRFDPLMPSEFQCNDCDVRNRGYCRSCVTEIPDGEGNWHPINPLTKPLPKLSAKDLATIRDLSTVIFDTLLLGGSKESITACFDRLLPEVKAELRKKEGELE